MKNPLVSIIMPVYGVDRWLESSLRSVLGQTYKNWELIVVVDASPDSCLSIAIKAANNDSRIKIVVHAVNEGLGGSRNTGVTFATGKYLCFLDGDDLLISDALETLVWTSEEYDADLTLSSYVSFSDKQSEPDVRDKYMTASSFSGIFPERTVFTWRFIQDNYDILMPSIYTTVCWGKLFRRDKWNDFGCIVPGGLRMAEDFIPVKRFLFLAARIVACDKPTVLYRKRHNSATSRRSKDSYEIFRAYDFALAMFRDIGVYHELEQPINMFFLQSFTSHLFSFTPYNKWFDFYKRAAIIIQGFPKDFKSGITFCPSLTWKKPDLGGFLIFLYAEKVFPHLSHFVLTLSKYIDMLRYYGGNFAKKIGIKYLLSFFLRG